MVRFPVNSTLAFSIGYNPETQILEVEFRPNGIVWQYYGVPEYMYNEMMSGSIGKYFNDNIKDQFPELKI
jgi:hypothetical protein